MLLIVFTVQKFFRIFFYAVRAAADKDCSIVSRKAAKDFLLLPPPFFLVDFEEDFFRDDDELFLGSNGPKALCKELLRGRWCCRCCLLSFDLFNRAYSTRLVSGVIERNGNCGAFSLSALLLSSFLERIRFGGASIVEEDDADDD